MTRSITLLACALIPAILEAQDACTYDACALRLEGTRIVAGQQGLQVSRLRPFTTPDIAGRLAVSDSATFHYRVFASNHVRGNLLNTAGGLAMGITLGAMLQNNDLGSPAVTISVGTAGAVAALIGTITTSRAQRAFTRAVWWYNRDLPR